MSEHFIKEIEIKNYKCFTDFKAQGFARVNLIGGKNNVGKTAFMEACYLKTHASSIQNLLFAFSTIAKNRDGINVYIKLAVSIEEILTSNGNFIIDDINYKVNNELYKSVVVQSKNIAKIEIDFSKKLSFLKKDNIVFLTTVGFLNEELKSIYKAVQLKDKDEILNKFLQDFDMNIEKFKIIDDIPYLKVATNKEHKKYRELKEFGDGIKLIISVISSIYATNNGTLFIDEIESGIHYSKLDMFWRAVLRTSKEQNVQIFATTHSKECIESYARVAKELEDEDISFIEFARNKDNEIKVMSYKYKWLQDEIEQEHEIRGW